MDFRRSVLQHAAQSRAGCGVRLGCTGFYPAGAWKSAVGNLFPCLIGLRVKNDFLIPPQKFVLSCHALLWIACLSLLDFLRGAGVCCVVPLMLCLHQAEQALSLVFSHRASAPAPTTVVAFAELTAPERESITGSHAQPARYHSYKTQ